MIRINAAWLINNQETFDDLEKLSVGQTVLDGLSILLGAQGALEQVFAQSFYRDHVRASHNAGNALYERLSEFLNHDNWSEKTFDDFDIAAIRTLKNTFKTVFLADLSVMPIYIVAAKDTFDINLLIESGIKLFPASILVKVPEVEKDASEVGRALAYELPTACGFHTFRVMESVVRRYWDIASGGKERPRLQTLGNLAVEMARAELGDEKVLEAIKQMTKLHRNPLIHPQVILSVEEAIGIIGMARSVIGMILQFLPDFESTTGATIKAARESAED